MQTEKTALVGELKSWMIGELKLKKQASEIGDNAPLFGDGGLGIDSLDGLQLGVAAEQKYNVRLDPQSAEGKNALASVSSLADFIIKNRKA
jgi:acyl carrier protein